jgi:hypothetical protein
MRFYAKKSPNQISAKISKFLLLGRRAGMRFYAKISKPNLRNNLPVPSPREKGRDEVLHKHLPTLFPMKEVQG